MKDFLLLLSGEGGVSTALWKICFCYVAILQLLRGGFLLLLLCGRGGVTTALWKIFLLCGGVITVWRIVFVLRAVLELLCRRLILLWGGEESCNWRCRGLFCFAGGGGGG